MITREQFEAHVMAEAAKKLALNVDPVTLPEYEFNRIQRIRRQDYIAARMEHEWPLVEAAQAVVDRWDTPLWKDVPHTGEFIGKLREALSPYTAKAAQP